MSEKLLITIKSSLQTVDVELPGDVCISDLLPLLAEVCGFSEDAPGAETMVWSLSASESAIPFLAKSTLADYGMLDGEILDFQEVSLQPTLKISTVSFEDITSSEETGWIGVTWRRVPPTIGC